jgi:hypothetical protein
MLALVLALVLALALPQDPIPTNKLSDLWGEFTNFHMTQFFLFLAKFAPRLTTWVGKWAWWLQSDGGVGQDHGFKVFTFDCLVSPDVCGCRWIRERSGG